MAVSHSVTACGDLLGYFEFSVGTSKFISCFFEFCNYSKRIMVALIISSFCLRSRLLVIATFPARTGSATKVLVWFSLVLRLPVSVTSLMFS